MRDRAIRMGAAAALVGFLLVVLLPVVPVKSVAVVYSCSSICPGIPSPEDVFPTYQSISHSLTGWGATYWSGGHDLSVWGGNLELSPVGIFVWILLPIAAALTWLLAPGRHKARRP